MSDRKFFSGLTDGMMTKTRSAPNRQQTNFYWPNETDSEQFVPTRNRLRNRTMSNASLMSQSQASTDTEESRRRKSQQNQSKIEFYDMVDVGTDTESVYSRSNDLTRHKKQETLKSRIEFYDYVETKNCQQDDDVQSVIERPVKRNQEAAVIENKQTSQTTKENGRKEDEQIKAQVESEQNNEVERNLTQSVQNLSLSPEPKNGFVPSYAPQEKNSRRKVQQYDDSFSDSEDDERFYRDRREDRNHLPPPQQYRYPPSRSIRSHPRRHNSEYFDFDDDGYDRYYESTSRRLKYRKPENIPRMARRRDYSSELSDEDFYDNPDGYRREYRGRLPPPDRYRSTASRLDDTESYYRGRNKRRPTNGFGSEMDFQRNSMPPTRKASPQNQNYSEVSSPAISNEVDQSEVEPRMPASARPPIKPLSRTMSINEAKQRHHVNLKSNIFHNDPEYNMIVEQRKPLSVREFAASQRVGVGLPDI